MDMTLYSPSRATEYCDGGAGGYPNRRFSPFVSDVGSRWNVAELYHLSAMRCLLYQAMGDLSMRQRHLVRRVYFEGWRPIDIAEDEGVPPSRIRKQLQRARVVLRRALEVRLPWRTLDGASLHR